MREASSLQRALPTERKVERGTSQSKGGTSVNLSNSGKRAGGRLRRHVTRLHASPQSYMKRDLNQNFSGNEVYYTNSLILLVKNMLFSKLHCQKGFNLNPFSYKIFR